MSECPNCQATDDPEHGIIVGPIGDGASSCTICQPGLFPVDTCCMEHDNS